jgi:hypothetical protein
MTEVKHECLQSIKSLTLTGIRKNFLIRGRSLLLYQFTQRMMKLTVISIMVYHCSQSYKTIRNIVPSILSQYINKITVVDKRGF